jgi:hypothetical protein
MSAECEVGIAAACLAVVGAFALGPVEASLLLLSAAFSWGAALTPVGAVEAAVPAVAAAAAGGVAVMGVPAIAGLETIASPDKEVKLAMVSKVEKFFMISPFRFF